MREEGGEVLLAIGSDGSLGSEEGPVSSSLVAISSYPLQENGVCSCVVHWKLLLWSALRDADFAGGVSLLLLGAGSAPKCTVPSKWARGKVGEGQHSSACSACIACTTTQGSEGVTGYTHGISGCTRVSCSEGL